MIGQQCGQRVIRIPYWVQLTSETLLFYFKLRAEIIQDFPHGFITTKFFPASFCSLGMKRFETELLSLPKNIKIDVLSSLRDRIEEHGFDFVMPKELSHLLLDNGSAPPEPPSADVLISALKELELFLPELVGLLKNKELNIDNHQDLIKKLEAPLSLLGTSNAYSLDFNCEILSELYGILRGMVNEFGSDCDKCSRTGIGEYESLTKCYRCSRIERVVSDGILDDFGHIVDEEAAYSDEDED